MHKRGVLLAGVLVLLLTTASCGSSGGSSEGASGSGTGSTTPAGSDGGSADGGGGRATSGGGKVDCASITKAAPDLVVSVQLLGQLRSVEAVDSVKSRTIGNFDVDRFLASMKSLHALDGRKSSLGGNVKDSIDTYEQAAKSAKVLLAADPPSQAQLDEYAKSIGSMQQFLEPQSTITGAIAEAGC